MLVWQNITHIHLLCSCSIKSFIFKISFVQLCGCWLCCCIRVGRYICVSVCVCVCVCYSDGMCVDLATYPDSKGVSSYTIWTLPINNRHTHPQTHWQVRQLGATLTHTHIPYTPTHTHTGLRVMGSHSLPELWTSSLLFFFERDKIKVQVCVFPYLSPCFVVLHVHHGACVLSWASWVILLPLPRVHELACEPVAVVNVVAAAAPQPVAGEFTGSRGPAAAAGGELALATRPADGVDHAGRAYGVGEGRFPGAWRETEFTSVSIDTQ